MNTNRIFSYQNRLLVLLTFTFGFVLFDRMVLIFMGPFFDKELGLNNTQIGLLASLLALAWAIMVTASSDKRRGFNMGFMQSFGSNLSETAPAKLKVNGIKESKKLIIDSA